MGVDDVAELLAEQRALKRWGLVGMGQLNFLCRPARGTNLADEK
jgi:hypothetical protein